MVLATYASLVDREDPENPSGPRGAWPAEAALAGGDRLDDQQMASFDLAVMDEAHGLAGDVGPPLGRCP
ncbi:hypothetical protein [Streptomyces sp. CA-132043]|uniref:hypothetical protein n=1 Tax=Streptomyces sp. CA-132043 TaxID=3240048 RepID=UPI003D902099